MNDAPTTTDTNAPAHASEKFVIVFEKEESGQWSVHVPAMEGCVSQGVTLEEAAVNIGEAIKLHCETLTERGRMLVMAKTIIVADASVEWRGEKPFCLVMMRHAADAYGEALAARPLIERNDAG